MDVPIVDPLIWTKGLLRFQIMVLQHPLGRDRVLLGQYTNQETCVDNTELLPLTLIEKAAIQYPITLVQGAYT